MSVSTDHWKTALDSLPAAERKELAAHLLKSLIPEDAGTAGPWRSFFQGMGSAPEFFPPLERLDPWRATQDIKLDEWPEVVGELLRELDASGTSEGNSS